MYTGWLVSWCFEPSLPQKIISGLNTNFTLNSMLFISQVIIPQVMFFEPTYIPRALNTGTCIQQGDLFYSLVYTGTGVSHSQRRKKLGEVLEKMQVNGPEG